MTSSDFSLITCSGLPDLDPDDRLLTEALSRRGFSSTPRIWSSPDVDWRAAGVCVIRSTWDYHLDHREFLAWVHRVAALTTIVNPPEIIAWNIRKTYLRELAEKGCPVISTVWVEAAGQKSLSDIWDETGWTDVVVKPVVGLSTYGVMRVRRKDDDLAAAEKHLAALAARDGAMVQEYLESVESHGERSLIFIDGRFSHAVRKSAFQKMAEAGKAGETPSAVAEVQAELAAAQVVLDRLPQVPAYARVDLVRDRAGQPRLMELELIEPSLFLSMSEDAAGRLADHLTTLLTRRGATTQN